MATKYLITTSIFSLISISIAQAADVIIPEQPEPVVAVPAFSWTGFYLGGQIGNFSSKAALSYLRHEEIGKWASVKKELLPKPSGFVGGIYGGFNFDFGKGFVIGVDTDVIWSNKKESKNINEPMKRRPEILSEGQAGTSKSGIELPGIEFPGIEFPNSKPPFEYERIIQATLKQKWAGATRVRVGFAGERLMPYIAGGVAYTQIQNTFVAPPDFIIIDFSRFLHDEKKTFVGYTLGGGVDFAMTDNVIMRAEYRYSDFGKKKFGQDRVEIGYKTNDFRVGVAYKF
ncbi:porin [Bartonella quintana]|uniref:outer membrane protein n=1 Tax=Bartonella quintana TaxID=803 RepID=UPI0013184427|nr:outer membrane protein [Bartonella quintana]BBL53599.1 porin [Bartonella quintana]